jgi:hypothetical protein
VKRKGAQNSVDGGFRLLGEGVGCSPVDRNELPEVLGWAGLDCNLRVGGGARPIDSQNEMPRPERDNNGRGPWLSRVSADPHIKGRYKSVDIK